MGKYGGFGSLTGTTKGKVMKVYDYLLWLNDNDMSIMQYIPKTIGDSKQ